MEKKYTTVRNLSIAYIEVNPESDLTLFFVHGNSVSSKNWRKQLSDPRFKNWRMVAIDLPAHGDSGVSDEPDRDYSLTGLGKIAVEAFKILVPSAAKSIWIGLSLGANILAEMLAFGVLPQGIALLGPSILGNGITVSDFVIPGSNTAAVFSDDVPDEIVRRYAAETSISTDPADKTANLEDYYQTVAPFRTLFAASFEAGRYQDEIVLLMQTALPVCVIFGKDEKVVDPYYLDAAPFALWREQVHLVENASHMVNIDNATDTNILLEAYVKDCLSQITPVRSA